MVNTVIFYLLSFLFSLFSFLLCNQPDAGEDEGGGDGVHPLGRGESHRHAGYHSDKGLHIVIDTHRRGQQAALGIYHEQEGEEGRPGDDIGDLAGGGGTHSLPVDLHDGG